jgi:hypothetical protein
MGHGSGWCIRNYVRRKHGSLPEGKAFRKEKSHRAEARGEKVKAFETEPKGVGAEPSRRPYAGGMGNVLKDALHKRQWLRSSRETAKKPVYMACEIKPEGRREILGFWLFGAEGESARDWEEVFKDLKQRRGLTGADLPHR